MVILKAISILGESDGIFWIPSKRHKFEVKSYYHVLTIPTDSMFPWKKIWRVKAPSKVVFFVWTTTLGKILMLDNLRKQNVIGGLVLYVQEEWGIHQSPSSSL
jgi:hypothetical protein